MLKSLILPMRISIIGSWLTVGAFWLFYKKIHIDKRISEKTRFINEITNLNDKLDKLNAKLKI